MKTAFKFGGVSGSGQRNGGGYLKSEKTVSHVLSGVELLDRNRPRDRSRILIFCLLQSNDDATGDR